MLLHPQDSVSVSPTISPRTNAIIQEQTLRTHQKLLKAQRDKPISIDIILLEDVRHTFQADARLHEEVETEHALVLEVVGVEELLNVGWGEAIAEGCEGGGEFGEGDCARVVDVEAVEEGAPGGEEGPEGTGWVSTVMWERGWDRGEVYQNSSKSIVPEWSKSNMLRVVRNENFKSGGMSSRYRIIILTVCGSNTV